MESINELVSEEQLEHQYSDKSSDGENSSSGGIQHPRHEAVKDLCLFMGDDPSEDFGKWLGRTKSWSANKIRRLMNVAKKEGDNPRALFEYFLKTK